MGYLYRISFESGKSYLGVTTKTMNRRMALHRHHAKTGRPGAIYGAIRKYRSYKVDVLVVADGWEYLCDLEKRAIAAFNTKSPNGYNLTDGGEGGFGYRMSPEQRERQSLRMKGKNKGNSFGVGYRHTDEAKAKIAASSTGRIFSEERRAKIGATKVGNKYNVGRPCSPERRAKISQSNMGKTKSPETRGKMSDAKRGKPWTEARRNAAKKKEANDAITPS